MARRRKIDQPGISETECYYCNTVIPAKSLKCPSCGKVFSSTKKLLAFTVVVIILVASLGFYAYTEMDQHQSIQNGLANDIDGDGWLDSIEIQYFGNLDRDGNGDFDNDGIIDKNDPTPDGGGPVTGDKTIKFELFESLAPNTCANFRKYASDGFYSGTIFHRVIDGFMIQGGGFNPGLAQKTATYPPINLEISPNLRHEDGSVAMARTNDPNSATCQFYICDGPQASLDDNYAVFGKVVEGMDVVRDISKVSTTTVSGFSDVPSSDVVTQSVVISVEGGKTYATLTVTF
jgi:peptidyl-prolyl cis-trans isomerase B (cyclophilin B)